MKWDTQREKARLSNIYRGEVITITTVTKPERPAWYLPTIHRLARYGTDVKRIAVIQRELSRMGVKTTVTYSDMPHGSGTSDSTGDLAVRARGKGIGAGRARVECGIN